MREIAELAAVEPRIGSLPPDTGPRIVDIDTSKLRSRLNVPGTRESLASFFSKHRS
jgi:hypothetical protein